LGGYGGCVRVDMEGGVMAGAIWFAVCAVGIVGFMTFVGICFWQIEKALNAVHDDD
jgi:hypothetical protein